MIVIIGNRGFIGRNLTRYLKAKGEVVTGFDKEDVDICSPDVRFKLFEGCTVVHLAALSSVAACDADPNEAVRVNVEGTMNLLNQCEKAKVKRIVYAGSGSALHPEKSLYAQTKWIAELLVKSHRVPWVVLRLAYTYGPDREDSIFHKWLTEKEPTVYRRIRRDFLYIEDACQAFWRALDTLHVNEVYEIGSGECQTLRQAFFVADRYKKWRPVDWRQPRACDFLSDCPDISRARLALGYNPKWGLERGINYVAERLAVRKEEE